MDYMCPTGTIPNLPALTDRDLIRIIPQQEKRKWDYGQATFIVDVSFCLENQLCWLKFLVVWRLWTWFRHITEEIPPSCMEGVGQQHTQTHTHMIRRIQFVPYSGDLAYIFHEHCCSLCVEVLISMTLAVGIYKDLNSLKDMPTWGSWTLSWQTKISNMLLFRQFIFVNCVCVLQALQ